MTLYEECLQALGDSVLIKSEDESKEIFQLFEKEFPLTKFGRIEWGEIGNKHAIGSVKEILGTIESQSKFYVLWDNAQYPVLQADLNSIINSIDDVTAVSFDTWLYEPNERIVIEFYHEGQIIIGKL